MQPKQKLHVKLLDHGAKVRFRPKKIHFNFSNMTDTKTDVEKQVSEQYSHLGKEVVDKIVEKIESVLASAKYQADPKKYMSEWTKKRGRTEELRIPEDQARWYLTNLNRAKC